MPSRAGEVWRAGDFVKLEGLGEFRENDRRLILAGDGREGKRRAALRLRACWGAQQFQSAFE